MSGSLEIGIRLGYVKSETGKWHQSRVIIETDKNEKADKIDRKRLRTCLKMKGKEGKRDGHGHGHCVMY